MSEKTTSIPNDNNEMSESHQQHYQQQQQSQRLSMEDATPPNSRLTSSTINIGVNEGFLILFKEPFDSNTSFIQYFYQFNFILGCQ